MLSTYVALCEKMTSSTKPEAHNIIAVSSKKGRVPATGNMYTKFREIETRGFRDMQADRQTNRHADRNILHPTWAKYNENS